MNRMLPVRETRMQTQIRRNQFISIVGLVILLSATLLAQSPPSPSGASALNSVMNTLAATKRFEQVAISPDGQKLAGVEAMGAGHNAIFIDRTASPSGARQQVTATTSGTADEESVAWSPDGTRLAFLS